MSVPFDNRQKVSFTAVSSGGLRISISNSIFIPNGTRVQFYAGGGLPTGLTADTTYFIRSSSLGYFNVSQTIQGTYVPYTNPGTAPNYFAVVNTCQCTVNASTDTITSIGHGLVNGNRVQFLATTYPSNIVENVTYIVANATADTFTITNTLGSAIDILSDGSDVNWCLTKEIAVTIDYTLDTISITGGNGVPAPLENQVVTFRATVLPNELSTGTIYYAVSATTISFKVSTSPGGTPINLTSNGTSVIAEFVHKNTAMCEYRNEKYEIHANDYRPPISSAVIASGTVIDGVLGTFVGSNSGGESWG